MQLSRNFWLEEFTRTNKPFPNVPQAGDIRNGRRLTEHLEVIRYHCCPKRGIRITMNGGFRSVEVNRASGGVPESAHRLFCAADIQPIDPTECTVEAMWRKVATLGLQFDQAIWEPDQNVLHYGISRPGYHGDLPRLMHFVQNMGKGR